LRSGARPRGLRKDACNLRRDTSRLCRNRPRTLDHVPNQTVTAICAHQLAAHFYARASVADLAATAYLLAEESRDGKMTAAAFRESHRHRTQTRDPDPGVLRQDGITIREGDLRRVWKDRLVMLESVGS
jgi:hypothetical protein